jgi:putative ATP-dependent endonuclease of the OLD family
MQIISVKVSNYRNLDGLEITFDPLTNFLIGENELGKSNLLDLFETLFNHWKFQDEDFTNIDTPIRIEFSLQLSYAEKAALEDYIDPDNNNVINIIAIQEYSDLDEEMDFFWEESVSTTPKEIQKTQIRKINYISYNSLKIPGNELTFNQGRGSGKFLRYLVDEFSDSDSKMAVNSASVSTAKGVQSFLNRIKIFRQQKIAVSAEPQNLPDFLSRVLTIIGGDGFDIQKSGFGIQFSTVLILSILERLLYLKQKKNFRPFEETRDGFSQNEYKVFYEMYLNETTSGLPKEAVFKINTILEPLTQEEKSKYHIDIQQLNQDEKNILGEKIIRHIKTRKSLSVILGLDEPEIHLHPYRQRHLVKYILELLSNQDSDFMFLLKKHFDVDVFNGQMLLVSHSPTVILDEYKNIVRFYKHKGTKAVSGSQINLDPSDKKYLLMNFPYIKEAFFSKCAVISEGQTEAGALPLWANKIIGDVDELGVVFINAGGDGGVLPVTKLLNHFQIPNVSIIDKDDGNDKKPKYNSIEGLRTTKLRDFEEELFEAVYKNDANIKELFDFLKYDGTHKLTGFVLAENMDKIAKTYKFPHTWNTPPTHTFFFKNIENTSDKNLLKAIFLFWLTKTKQGKTIIAGRALGEVISTNCIPEVYIQLFKDAKSKSEA